MLECRVQAPLLADIINQHSYESVGIQRSVRFHRTACNLYKTLLKDSEKAASFISRVTIVFQKIFGLIINSFNSEQENSKWIGIHKTHL